MKRLKEILAKNITAHELKDCEDCETKDTCDHLPSVEENLKAMD